MKYLYLSMFLSLSFIGGFSQSPCDNLTIYPLNSFSSCPGDIMEVYVQLNDKVDSARVTRTHNGVTFESVRYNWEWLSFTEFFSFLGENEVEVTISDIAIDGEQCDENFELREGVGFLTSTPSFNIISKIAGNYELKEPFKLELSAEVIPGNIPYTSKENVYTQNELVESISFQNGVGDIEILKPGDYRIFPQCGIFNFRVVDSTYGKVSGHVYLDGNENCAYNYPEKKLVNKKIEVDGGTVISSDAKGEFEIFLPYGEHTFTLLGEDTLSKNICEETITVEISRDKPFEEISFFTTLKDFHDLGVKLRSTRTRPGFEFYYSINASNFGPSSEDATLKFIHDPRIAFISSSRYGYTISGDTLIWDLSMPPGNVDITVVFEVPADVSLLGETLIAEAKIEGLGNDLFTDNNKVKRSTIIVGSYDPNDIELTTSPYNNQSDIALQDSLLDYTVHFQNTGTAEATYVKVIDTIPEYLEPESIVITGNSHDMYWHRKENILEFYFDFIDLVPQSESEFKSQGFVSYKARQKESNQQGDVIKNKAEIYFDFNPAIITSETSNRINSVFQSTTTGLGSEVVKVYPNPTNSAFFVKLEAASTVQVLDIKGNTLLEETVEKGELKFGNELPTGVYFIKVFNGDNLSVVKAVKFN